MLFQVNRSDIRATQLFDNPVLDLAPGQIRLSIERFAITTNNVTYAVAGDLLDYWGFFPTVAPWGHIPVMGLSTVVESANPDIETGGRYFGFTPMTSEVVMTVRPRRNGFRDVGPHRASHATAYTDFSDVTTDASFRAEQADEYLLLRGMFMTSFLIDDYLDDHDFHGATQTLVTSASSKTSISLATCLARREGHRCVGLTSERNRAFVEGLGLYDQVVTYTEVHELEATTASTLVDMAGNGTVRAAVHSHFNEHLKASLTVGLTHWENTEGPSGLAGPVPEFFFAPAQSTKRAREWGVDVLQERLATSFLALLDGTDQWLNVEHRLGPAGVEATYRDLLEGRADPAMGFICSMNSELRVIDSLTGERLDTTTTRPRGRGAPAEE